MTAETSQIERVFRAEFGRCVAALISAFADIDIAEDRAGGFLHRPPEVARGRPPAQPGG